LPLRAAILWLMRRLIKAPRLSESLHPVWVVTGDQDASRVPTAKPRLKTSIRALYHQGLWSLAGNCTRAPGGGGGCAEITRGIEEAEPEWGQLPVAGQWSLHKGRLGAPRCTRHLLTPYLACPPENHLFPWSMRYSWWSGEVWTTPAHQHTMRSLPISEQGAWLRRVVSGWMDELSCHPDEQRGHIRVSGSGRGSMAQGTPTPKPDGPIADMAPHADHRQGVDRPSTRVASLS